MSNIENPVGAAMRKARVVTYMAAITEAVDKLDDKSVGIYVSALQTLLIGVSVSNGVPLELLIKSFIQGYASVEAHAAETDTIGDLLDKAEPSTVIQ